MFNLSAMRNSILNIDEYMRIADSRASHRPKGPPAVPPEPETGSAPDLSGQLKHLLDPASVAVIGASANTQSWSGRALLELQRLGFRGGIYPVNPKHDELHGLPCYPSVAGIPGPVDAALIFVPKHALPDVLEECGAKGVRGAVILASGFSETGAEGRATEETLREIANRHHIAICGPNCLGFANLARGFMGLTAATFPADLSPGRTALISQSGQLMMVLLARAHDQGVHLRYLVSTGNELNVEAADYARAALADPEITSVAMALEGLRSSAKFLDLARAAQAARKPLIALKLGRSERAARTALAHTGKMAGAQRTYAAVFRQHNVIAVDDPFELADVAALFEKCPTPRGPRVSVVSFSGGWCGVIADQAEELGIPMADFTDETTEKLRPLLDFTPPVNPLDLSGNVNNHPERWPASLRAVLDDDNTDIMVVFIHQVRAEWRDNLIDPLLEIARDAKKPILVIYDGGKVVEDGWDRLAADRSLPIYRGSRPMLTALRHFLDYHARQRRPDETLTATPRDTAASATARDALNAGGPVLSEHRAKTVLRHYGLPMVEEHLADNRADAVRAATELGFPVVLKGLADGQEHKTEAGLVRLNLSTPAEVETTFGDLKDALSGHSLEGGPPAILVQKMASGGAEAILGMQNDPDFGPMILVGTGGTMTELLDDVALRRAPLTPADVTEMIDETLLARLFDGFRGAPRADRTAFEQMVLRFSDLAVDLGDRIESIDINPVFVRPEGQGCLAVDALIVKAEAAT